MKDQTERTRSWLLEQGADLVGFADLSDVESMGYPRAVVVAIRLAQDVVREIEGGPTKAYYDAYHDTNRRLDELVVKAEKRLKEEGYRAYALQRSLVPISKDHRTPLPLKTIAYRTGLGWIGKSNLLLTPEYGGAFRLSAVLTDAPFETSEERMPSRCGSCTICVEGCPAKALTGNVWEAGMEREKMFDAFACADMANRLCEENFGISDAEICGICFANCPYTKRYTRPPDA